MRNPQWQQIMLRFSCAQCLCSYKQVAQSPFSDRHQPRLTFFAVLRDFPYDANLALLQIDVLELEIPEVASAAPRAYGNGRAVHSGLRLLISQRRRNKGFNLVLVCDFASTLLDLAERLIPLAEVAIPAARIGHYTSQQEHLVIHGPAGYRLAHCAADVFSAFLVVLAYMRQRNRIHAKVRGKVSLYGLEDPPLPRNCGVRTVRQFSN